MNWQNLTANWKTTSAGLLLVIGSVIHLVFATKSGKADEGTWTASMTGIVGGLGLIFARDSSQSNKTVAELQAQLDVHDAAIRTGDTSILNKPTPKP